MNYTPTFLQASEFSISIQKLIFRDKLITSGITIQRDRDMFQHVRIIPYSSSAFHLESGLNIPLTGNGDWDLNLVSGKHSLITLTTAAELTLIFQLTRAENNML